MTLKSKTIAGYTLLKYINSGGMADVWYAENSLGKSAAVKILKPKFVLDQTVVDRFMQEAKIMLNLKHSNIREVFDIGEIDNRPAMVMEYLDGQDLGSLLVEKRKLSPSELKNYWNQCTLALQHIHKKGIVHRDLKPSNIFLTNKGIIQILDFGISKDINSGKKITKTDSYMGSITYSSPEQIRSAKYVDQFSDIYSLAVTFVHLASGKTPYNAENLSDYKLPIEIVENTIDLNGVPIEWQNFLKPYLEKNSKRRDELKLFSKSEETIIITPPPPTLPQIENPKEPIKKKTKKSFFSKFFTNIFSTKKKTRNKYSNLLDQQEERNKERALYNQYLNESAKKLDNELLLAEEENKKNSRIYDNLISEAEIRSKAEKLKLEFYNKELELAKKALENSKISAELAKTKKNIINNSNKF
jgi:serine/threonine protein kinase